MPATVSGPATIIPPNSSYILLSRPEGRSRKNCASLVEKADRFVPAPGQAAEFCVAARVRLFPPPWRRSASCFKIFGDKNSRKRLHREGVDGSGHVRREGFNSAKATESRRVVAGAISGRAEFGDCRWGHRQLQLK